ncbi:hypothetical protein [Aminipila terrae]|uniref:hypothetical protein n=1 Tax=Aminipila terrae TaxID=2697030 RepID=UPI001FAE28A6|nr:hypothetical protein [Aminipila terrae]
MEIIETKKDISSCMDVNFNCAWRQKYGKRCKVHGNLGKIQEALNQQLKSYSIYKILFEDSN